MQDVGKEVSYKALYNARRIAEVLSEINRQFFKHQCIYRG